VKVITITNEKGGVGKSSVSVQLAAGLAIRGYKVLLIDSDPQGHSTVALDFKKEPGLYELLVRDAAFKDVLRLVEPEKYTAPSQPSQGRLFLVPSNIETRVIPMMISDALKFQKKLTQLKDIIDIVVIDTAPTPSLLHASIYMASDYLVYPTTCEYLSFDGLVEALGHQQAAQPMREQYGLGKIKVIGVIPTMFRSSTVEHTENLNLLKKQFGALVWKPIPQRTIWAEASSRQKTVFALAPESKAAEDAWGIVERVMEVLNHESSTTNTG